MDGDERGQDALADEMFAQMMRDGQSTRRVELDIRAETLRQALRRLGRSAGIQLRTARMGDVVVVARLDAALWTDSSDTMRAKLAPPS